MQLIFSVCMLLNTWSYAAAEMVDLRGAVANLRSALADLSANTELAQEGVLKLNVIEARASLSRRLDQLTPAALNLTVSSGSRGTPHITMPVRTGTNECMTRTFKFHRMPL